LLSIAHINALAASLIVFVNLQKLKIMRRVLRLLLPTLILFGHNLICRPSVPKLKIRVNTINLTSKDSAKVQKKIFYNICFQIWNNSNSEVRYWTMTCSWQNLWIFDKPEISFTGQDCDSNVPELTQILPGQIKFFSSKVYYKGNIQDTANIEFKIGFILVKKKELNNFLDIFGFYGLLSKKREKQKDIIWSEPFKLKVTPEIKMINVKKMIGD
jgi:hypothetical protein